MRILCLDIGDVRIGVAVSDPLGISTNGVETHLSKGAEADATYFAELARSLHAEKILLGLPLNMDGTEGDRAEKVRAFGALLGERSGLPVDYEDERLTTVEAEEMLIEAGLSRQERRKVIDKVAAEIILRCYLNK
ncbi:MAG: Holliday junction resolvase RuvX [Clostridia bacterium]|nr:Holliday junction resolvase RuvX [Clostridia bacterium]